MVKAVQAVASSKEYGLERSHDVRWNDKKVIFFKTLKKVGEGTMSEVAEASGGKLKGQEVRHYAYHAASPAAQLVKIQQFEDGKFRISLTAKGKKIDPDKELATQEAAKAEKKPRTKPAKEAPAAKAAVKATGKPGGGKTVKKAAKKAAKA